MVAATSHGETLVQNEIKIWIPIDLKYVLEMWTVSWKFPLYFKPFSKVDFGTDFLVTVAIYLK
jgi:hypothetical protein